MSRFKITLDQPVGREGSDPPGRMTRAYDNARHRRRTVERADLLRGWIEDRLPTSLQGRAFLGGRELGLIALVAAIALCVAAGIALRSSAAVPTSQPKTALAQRASSGPSAAPLVRARPSPGARVVVDVVGAVVHPGVVTLPNGSRVFEALKAAGGAKRGADVSATNLARVLVDGEQIVVGAHAVAVGHEPGPGSGLVSLNQATASRLEDLPGIGPTMAKNILDWRSRHGRFTRIEELQEVTGIGPKTFAKLKPLVGL